jgi:hypothetical protein
MIGHVIHFKDGSNIRIAANRAQRVKSALLNLVPPLTGIGAVPDLKLVAAAYGATETGAAAVIILVNDFLGIVLVNVFKFSGLLKIPHCKKAPLVTHGKAGDTAEFSKMIKRI